MKKLTAVEWLHSEYIKIFGELNPSTAKLLEIAYALEQAKEMEKEKRIKAHQLGYDTGYKVCEMKFNGLFKSE